MPYTEHRPDQLDAIRLILQSPARVIGVCGPPGFGKSELPVAVHATTGLETRILVGTRALEQQYMDSYAAPSLINLVDVRGRDNYRCIIKLVPATAAQGVCRDGVWCRYRAEGCPYYDAVKIASEAGIAVTNYPFQVNRRSSLGDVVYLFCDEADTLFDILSDYLRVVLRSGEVRRLLHCDLPGAECNQEELRSWAVAARETITVPPSDNPVKRQTKSEPNGLRELREQLSRLMAMRGEWVLEHVSGRDGALQTVTATPVWPVDYLEDLVYRSAPKIVLMSATLTENDVRMLTPASSSYDYRSYPSRIPVHRRRIMHVRCTPMRGRTGSRTDWQRWTVTADRLLLARRDRRSIFSTTSYERQHQYLKRSELTDICPAFTVIAPVRGEPLDEAIDRFRHTDPPTVLVSPAIVRGYSFQGDDCRLLIVGKMPFPPPSPLLSARRKRNPGYQSYAAMQTLQQEIMRPVRDPSDWAELVIIDDDWAWLQKSRSLMLPWFEEAIGYSVDYLPPLPLDWSGEGGSPMR